MKDALGRDVLAGDTIAYAVRYGSSSPKLEFRKVIGVGPSFVETDFRGKVTRIARRDAMIVVSTSGYVIR